MRKQNPIQKGANKDSKRSKPNMGSSDYEFKKTYIQILNFRERKIKQNREMGVRDSYLKSQKAQKSRPQKLHIEPKLDDP